MSSDSAQEAEHTSILMAWKKGVENGSNWEAQTMVLRARRRPKVGCNHGKLSENARMGSSQL